MIRSQIKTDKWTIHTLLVGHSSLLSEKHVKLIHPFSMNIVYSSTLCALLVKHIQLFLYTVILYLSSFKCKTNVSLLLSYTQR